MCVFRVCKDRLPGGRGDRAFVFRIISPSQPTAKEIAASSEDEMTQWIQCIRECSCNAERVVSYTSELSVHTPFLLKVKLFAFELV